MEHYKLILDNANIKYIHYCDCLYIKEYSVSYIYLAILNLDYIFAEQHDLKVKKFSIEDILDTDDNVCLFLSTNKILCSCPIGYDTEEIYSDYKKWKMTS